MIHYIEQNMIKMIEINEPIEKEFSKLRSSDLVYTITEPKIEVLNNLYFQFPSDDEVDV